MKYTTTLDAAALARLRELDPDGRHGVVLRVMAAFETSLARILEQLAGNPSAAVVGSVAHTLKSSSASVGALALSRACAEAELGVRSGAAAELDEQVQRLVYEGQAALAAVRAMLRNQAPSA